MMEFLLLEEKFEQAEFYELAETPNPDSHDDGTQLCRIHMDNVSCKWHYNEPDLTLNGITLEIAEGTMLAIVGPTGSGKSSFLSAILGELPVVEGKLKVQGRIAYVSQDPWLFPGTIEQNIIFGKSVNPLWYNKVVDICGLEADFDTMEDGDQTSVVHAVLSGGQKARISLARAIYSNCDIFLLDDPL